MYKRTPIATRRFARPRPRRAFTLVELVIVIGLILLLVAITVTVSVGVLRQSEVRETQNVITILDNALEEWLLQEGRRITYGRGANHPDVDSFGEPCPGEGPQRVYHIPQLTPAGTTWANENDDGPGETFRSRAQRETDLLIATLLRRPVFEDMIASIDSRFMRRIEIDDPPDDLTAGGEPGIEHLTSGDYPDFNNTRYIYRFRDAWDRPILAVHPGREFDHDCPDDDSYCIGQGTAMRCADDDGTIRTPLENVFGVAESRRIFFVSAGPSERFGHLHLDTTSASLSDAQKQQNQRAADNIYSYPVMIDQARPGLGLTPAP